MAEQENATPQKHYWIETVKDNWSWAAPILYIYFSYVGMALAWSQYKIFGINIIEFSEINDFLLAGFREPLSFLAVFIMIFVYVMQSLAAISTSSNFKTKTGRKFAKIIRPLSYFMIIGIIIYTPFMVPGLLHGSDAKWKKEFLSQPERKVKVAFKDMDKIGYKEAWVDDLILLGTTDKYIFFIRKSNEELLATTLSNVLLISRAKPSK